MKKVLQILMIPALLFMTSCSNQPATAANRTETIVITAPKAVEAVPAQTDETEIAEILFEPLTEPEFSMQPESAEPEPIAPEENEEPAAVIPEAEIGSRKSCTQVRQRRRIYPGLRPRSEIRLPRSMAGSYPSPIFQKEWRDEFG